MCRRRLEGNLRGDVENSISTGQAETLLHERRASSTGNCTVSGWESLVTNANAFVRMDEISNIVQLPGNSLCDLTKVWWVVYFESNPNA